MANTLQTLASAFASINDESIQPSTFSFLADDASAAIASAQPVQSMPAPPGAPFSTIYAFGDSLTDAGNVAKATAGVVPVSPPYDHVFSNGPVWVQDLAQDLGLPAIQPSLSGGIDFAYGGAETGQTPNHITNPTDLPSQIGQFIAQAPSPQPNALYAMWFGSNDVLDIANSTALSPSQQQTDVTDAVANEVDGIQSLAARGATNFLVLNVPDLGQTPYEQARGPAIAQSATSLASLYDTDLSTAIQGLEASGALRIDLVNTFAILDQVIANPSAYGFTDVTTPAWTGNLTNSNSGTLSPGASTHLFFDGLHPTAQAHALLASDIAQNVATTA